MGATIEILTSGAATPVARPHVAVLQRPEAPTPDLCRRLRLVTLVHGALWFPALPVLLALHLAGWRDPRVDAATVIWTAIAAAVPLLVRLLARALDRSWQRTLALGFHAFALLSFAPIALAAPAALVWPAAWTLFFAAVVPVQARHLAWASAAGLGALGAIVVPETQALLCAGAAGVVIGVAVGISTLRARELGKPTAMPRQMGSYHLVRQIGAGGMGEVWLARHNRLDRPAAVKLLRPESLGIFAPDDVAALRSRFEREAQVTAMLRSPHTVSLHDFGVAGDGTLYYAMELLDGMTLEQLVRRHGPQPVERVAAILLQLCESLEEAHRAGLVHRDLKPANVMLTRLAGRLDFVKLLDFGLVKRSSALDPRLTAEGTVTGTPGFMAPEIAMNSGDVDGRADLYALGCVAFWLLTGRLVFEAKTPMGMAMAHVSLEPPMPSQSVPGIPEAFEDIVLDLLAKDPDLRPLSAGELADRIAATGLASAWTRERARDWWNVASPGKPARMAAQLPDLGRKAA